MKMYRLKHVLEITGMSRASIYRWEAAKEFPQKRQLGRKAVGWLASEVDEWLVNRPHSN